MWSRFMKTWISLGYEACGTMHQPCDMGAIALRQHCELGGVVALERREEIELDDDLLGRGGFENFHVARLDILSPSQA